MKTMIVYASSKGYAADCASRLKEGIKDSVLVDLKKDKHPDLSSSDAVIIGGSIHAGTLQGSVRKFCAAHEDELQRKKLVGLFLCALEEKDIEGYFTKQFPLFIQEKALVKGWFGGRVDLTQHNFFIKMILKKAAGMKESVFAEKPEEVSKFTESFNSLAAQKT